MYRHVRSVFLLEYDRALFVCSALSSCCKKFIMNRYILIVTHFITKAERHALYKTSKAPHIEITYLQEQNDDDDNNVIAFSA